MSTTNQPTSLAEQSESNGSENDLQPVSCIDAFQLPVETEIYILPDGQVVIADLPAELAQLQERIGSSRPVDGSSCLTQVDVITQ